LSLLSPFYGARHKRGVFSSDLSFLAKTLTGGVRLFAVNLPFLVLLARKKMTAIGSKSNRGQNGKPFADCDGGVASRKTEIGPR
jgi:hypothetical protein